MDHSRAHDVRTTHTDNVVFNCRFENKSRTQAVPLEYSSNRNGDILKANGMYYCTVDSFRIPNKALPIFKFENNLIDPANPAEFEYMVSVETNTDINAVAVQFENRGDLINPGNQDSGNIYYISQFLDMVNTALRNAYALSPGAIAADAPKFAIDVEGDSNRFSLLIPPSSGATVVLADGIGLSYKLYTLFEGFDADFNNYTGLGTSFLLQSPQQEILPAGEQIEIFQEHHSLYNWTDVEQILIFSSDLPIEPENFSNKEESGNDLKFKILASFTPFSREDGNIDKTDFTYRTEYPKLIDLKSTIGLRNINFKVGILKKDGSLEKLYALPYSISVLKLRFVKRALFNNEYNLAGLNERLKHHALENYHQP